MLLTVGLSIVLGFIGCIFYQQITMVLRERRNFGKKLFVNRRQCGRLVSMRYSGSKKYFFVDEDYILNPQPYEDKKEAIDACQQKFMSNRPKQSVFARIA